MFWPLRKPSSSVFGSNGPERRRAARYDTTVLNCHLGEVLDLSATGLRVRCSGKPPLKQGDLTKITITSPSDGLYAAAMVAWIKRRGWKSFEMGLRFTDAKPALAYAAENMASSGLVRGAEAPPQSQPRVPAAKVELVNHYSVLGVPYSASTQEIHAAFRLLAAATRT